MAGCQILPDAFLDDGIAYLRIGERWALYQAYSKDAALNARAATWSGIAARLFALSGMLGAAAALLS